MKNITSLLFVAAMLCGLPVQGQVLLQDFSSTTGAFFYGTWEATGDADGSLNPNLNFVPGSGVFDFTGTTGIVPTNEAGSKVEFFTVPGIGSNTALAISAQTLATNVASSFTVTLFDDGGRLALSVFSTLDFVTGSYTTITAPLTFDGGFNSANIDSMVISGNQPGGSARFNVSLNNIAAVTAVPEPGAYAALAAVSALGCALWRRRARSS